MTLKQVAPYNQLEVRKTHIRTRATGRQWGKEIGVIK